ncbi:MAG: acetyl-CoA carboxylase, biotin carboxyl carrier protein, partial [Sphingomonadales bacterium]|nr:acetyl-CoA carboxylase, biotin carboxyl carrier protein [Sphingomonadales bacterium]
MAKSTKSNDESKFIREMAELLSETNLSEIEVEREGLRVRVARQLVAAPAAIAVAPAAAPAAPAAAPAEAPVANAANHAGAVKSPMVGTVYLSPEPEAAPFVNVGDQVKEGQTILIIEAMKVMNP